LDVVDQTSWLSSNSLLSFPPRRSACREAWYCGTACSRADWKLGHRRLCKAMAAWHQQQKEAAVQQRAEQRRPEVAGQG